MIIVQPVGPTPSGQGTTRTTVVIRERQANGRTGPLDVVVLDAQTRHALATVRELGRAGLRVGAAATVRGISTFASRWCQVGALLPGFIDHPQGYGDGLMALLGLHPTGLLIPTSPVSIEALRGLRKMDAFTTPVALAAADSLDVALDTQQLHSVAARLGIVTPRRAELTDWSTLPSALREVGLPAVMGPHGASTPVVVASEDAAWDEVHRLVASGEWDAWGRQAVIEQWLPGPHETISLLYAHDHEWAPFAQRVLRTLPSLPGHDGAPIARVSIPLPSDTFGDTVRLVRTLHLEGFSEAIFRRDHEGRPVLIRLVPYLTNNVELAARSGINYPRLLYAWATGEPLWNVPAYRVGIRLRWLGGDLRAFKGALAASFARRPDPAQAALTPGQALGTLLRESLRRTGYDSVDWADPRPAVVSFSRMAVRTLLGRPVDRLEEALAEYAPLEAQPRTMPPTAPIRGRVTMPLTSQLG